ncbi:hypothetical protein CERSUDRAFT_119222 [Gelatoporia subvermispora B]|uniref:SET domain-containing protein n=1 Tax=Ceriporiopsis subvermispora (strain B) TaxID=914234 RepID=M2QIJ6_CERS8|nr:hypothetical protein CERSUDRAFT_119222 [Gelatoporia subvermispora B]
MSFASLRSARKSKESRSFVNPLAAQISPGTLTDPGSSPIEGIEGPSSTGDTTGSPKSPSYDVLETVSTDGLYKCLPSYLEVRQVRDAGRGIITKERQKAGSTLIATKPHVTVLSTTYLDSYCSACCGPAPETGLKRCTRCRVVWYCDSCCQNNDWPIHKDECIAIQRWASSAPSPDVAIPSDAIRCLGRILLTQQHRGLDSIWSKEINAMQSHRSSMQPSAVESHTHMAHSLVRYLGIANPAELAPFGLNSAGNLVDLISRFATNTFTLTSFSLTPIGICICPSIALANHSCEPNAAIVFPRSSSLPQAQEPLMHLMAIRDIAPNEQVVAAYVDVTLPRELRQKALQETYSFTCKCKLCTKRMAVDPRAAMWCPKLCGGICPVPTEEDNLTRCTKCNTAVTSADAVLDALRVGQEALDKASSLQIKEPAKAKHITTNMIPILTSANLTPSCHPLLAMTRLHQELLIADLPTSLTQQALDDIIRTTAKYSAGLSSILPEGHPVRGVALAELGKLLAVDEPSPPEIAGMPRGQARFPPSGPARLKLAYETLLKAREELVIGFGADGGGGIIGKEVRETIVRLEKELGVWTHRVKDAIEDARAAKKS